jgi:membrane protein DedA with SNARE-associated domain
VQDFLFTFIGKWSYLGLFAILIAAGLGVPLPEDIPLVASGWLVHRGAANLYLMMATGLLGVMVGDSLLFNMGRRYGDHILEHRWLRRIAKPWLVEKARHMYLNHGAKILFAARFMPGIRSVMFLVAGAFRVPFWKFFLIDGFAALISVPVWVWAGWKFSGSIEELLADARTATLVVVGALVGCLILWIIWEYRHNLSKRAAERMAQATQHSAPLHPVDVSGGGSGRLGLDSEKKPIVERVKSAARD